MISADALIQALQRRLLVLAPHRRRPPGEFPPGWQQWFDAMHARPGQVTGAPPQVLVDLLAQRPLAGPPRPAGELTRWQAFSALWRQQWQPPEPEDRGVRWLAGGISAVWHLVLAGLLLWLMYLDLTSEATAPPKGEELVVQIEYVGAGTPEEVGGGPELPTEPRPEVAAASAQPSPAPAVPTPIAPEPAAAPAEPEVAPDMPLVDLRPVDMSQPALEMPAPEVVEREIALAEPAPAPQELTVSEPVPDTSEAFVLPPPSPPIPAPAIAMPELEATMPQLEVVDIPRVPRPSAQRLPTPTIEQPVLSAPAPEVAIRDVPAPTPTPAPQPVVPVIRPQAPEAPRVQADVPPVRERAIAVQPREVPATPASPVQSRPETGADAPARPPAAAAPERESGSDARPAPAPSTLAGPEKAPAPGGWPTPERADDWGMADTEQPGAQLGEPPGLYNSDGSVRLAETPGSAAPGQPPGTITEEIADLDRAGTWLRRAPNDYEPTTFDPYWRPNETLLAEWVRKSVSTIRIPIPGTNKHIVCQTVLLVVGGGCGIQDPNLNEQPATARPPPDVPFKPELQEDNGSRSPAGG